MVLEDWSVEDLDNLLRGYRSIMDFLAAIHAEKLYRAYPDAKFILVRPPIQIPRDILRLDMKTKLQTTRDPDAWERSLKATILTWYNGLKSKPDKSKPEQSFLEGLERDVVSMCLMLCSHWEGCSNLFDREVQIGDPREGRNDCS